MSDDSFSVAVLTPERALVRAARASSLLVPTTRGQMGILPGHARMVAALAPGVLSLSAAAGDDPPADAPSPADATSPAGGGSFSGDVSLPGDGSLPGGGSDGSRARRFFVSDGVLRTCGRDVLVLARAAEEEGDVDPARARKALASSEDALAGRQGSLSDDDLARAEARGIRARIRLRLAEGRQTS